MGRHSTHDGKISINNNTRVTRSTFLASRRITRSGKEFSTVVSPCSLKHIIRKSTNDVQNGNTDEKVAAAAGAGGSISGSGDVASNISAILGDKTKARDMEESSLLSDDSEATIAITGDALISDSRVKNLMSEIIKSKRHPNHDSRVIVDISTSQTCTQCLSGDKVPGKMRTPHQIVITQPQKECSSVATLFQQRMKRSLSLALGGVTPAGGDSDAEKEALVFNARKGISTKVYLSCIIDDLMSVMGTLACELVGEASYTCMQDSLLSGLMNEEIGEVCEKMTEMNERLKSLNSTVNDIVCEQLENLYEADTL